MRRGFGIFGLFLTVVLLAIVGAIAYNVGWSDGAATHVAAGTAVAPPYYYGAGPGFWGFGFGIFGLLWFLFIVFGLFWVVRIAFFGRRHWGGGWGYGRGFNGHSVPPAIDERMQEWHKRAHAEQPASPTPPPDQRSV
jgi:hypothetical protein